MAKKSSIDTQQQDDPTLALRRKNRNIRLTAWVQASRQHGFLQKGQKFNTIPKKGTAEHMAIKEAYNQLVAEWLSAGDVPEEFRRPTPTVDVNITVVQSHKRKRRTKKTKKAKKAKAEETTAEEEEEEEKPKKRTKKAKKAEDEEEPKKRTKKAEVKPKTKRAPRKKPAVTIAIPDSEPSPRHDEPRSPKAAAALSPVSPTPYEIKTLFSPKSAPCTPKNAIITSPKSMPATPRKTETCMGPSV